MKINYTLLVFLFFSIFTQAQITFQGCNSGTFGNILNNFPDASPITYTLHHDPSANVGTRNTYVSNVAQGCYALGGGFCYLRIIWAGSRWEIQLDLESNATFNNYLVIYYNTTASMPNPPSLNLGTWEENQDTLGPGMCAGLPPTLLSGDVQDGATLGVDTVRDLKKIKIFPNPSNDFIQVSGLKAQKSFTVYNVLGAKVKTGVISNETQINIRNLKKGFYFLEFKNGNTINFIKK